MRTLLLLMLVLVTDAFAQDRVIIIRRGRPPLVINRRPGVGPAATGYLGRVNVIAPNRFDWKYAAPPGLLDGMPKDAPMGGFAESYQLLLPPDFVANKPQGLVLHLSASSSPEDYTVWDAACKRFGLILACPVGVGDDVHSGVRLRTALAVLDDLRQRMLIDPDRVYITGTGQGALTACQVAYSFPEFVGGVVAFGSATSLRAEPWMRDRVRERLSVVLVAGMLDPARHELERVRTQVLKQSEVTHRMVTIPDHAQGLPPTGVLEQILAWLEMGRLARFQHGKVHPAARMPEQVMPKPEEISAAIVEEAKGRLKRHRTDEGLMQLEGVVGRWPMTPAAREARVLLDEHDAKGKRTWKEWYDLKQMEHFSREARALDEFAMMLAGVRGAAGQPALVKAAIAMYEQVERFGPDTREGLRAAKRLEALRKK